MNNMFWIMKLLRYVATAVGGYIAAQGELDPAQTETLIGAVLTIFSVIVSILQSKGRIDAGKQWLN